VEVQELEDPPTEIRMDVVFEDFAPPAGEPRDKPDKPCSDFERLKEKQRSSGKEPWDPFTSPGEWGFAQWIVESGLSQQKVDDMLKLDVVSKPFRSVTLSRTSCQWLTEAQLQGVAPSFGNKRALIKKVDELQTGPKWEHEVVSVVGEGVNEDGEMVTENVDLWRRDPIECVRELLSNPAFEHRCHHKPRKAFTDESKTDRVYGEMSMGDWWWETQVRIVHG